MIELVLVIMALPLIFLVNSFWFSLGIIVLLIFILIPGIYAMAYGAPFIDTDRVRANMIMELGKFGAEDIVYDLGCGSGRLIREIAGRGVKEAIGYEFSIPTYLWAKFLSLVKGRGEEIRFGNFWKKDFSDADVVICFLLERTMNDFEKKLWPKLTNGVRVISNEFQMNNVMHEDNLGRVYLYVKNN